jgi:hypothetical protein
LSNLYPLPFKKTRKLKEKSLLKKGEVISPEETTKIGLTSQEVMVNPEVLEKRDLRERKDNVSNTNPSTKKRRQKVNRDRDREVQALHLPHPKRPDSSRKTRSVSWRVRDSPL